MAVKFYCVIISFFIVLAVLVLSLFFIIYEQFGKCEVSCLEHWINHHRKDPSDFIFWKSKLCSLFKSAFCNRPMMITLINDTDWSLENVGKDVWSSEITESYTVVSVNNLTSLQTKQQPHLGHDLQMEHRVYIYDVLIQDFTRKLYSDFNSTQDHVRLCNFKDNNKDDAKRDIVLQRIPSIFSIHHIIDDNFIKKEKHYIKLLLFAPHGSDCSLLMQEVLIFITAFNFVSGTYTFSNEHYYDNLSISQHLFRKDIYITEDGQSYFKNWMCFRLPFYFLYIYLCAKIWIFTEKTFEAKPRYRFVDKNTRSFPTYVCNPLLISANTPCIDMLITYILEKAWFRKILIIGSSFFSTYTMLSFISNSIQLFDFKHEFISIVYSVLLFIIFLIECLVRCIHKDVKLLPEPIEAYELSIIMSAMPLCVILFFVDCIKSIYYYKIAYIYKALDSQYLLAFALFALINCIYFEYSYSLTGFFLISLLCTCLKISWSNLVYWTLRTILWVYLLLIVNLVRMFLQHFVNLYSAYVITMLSIQIWVPLVALVISYLRDVLIEYNGVFKQYFKLVISLIESSECNDAEKIVIMDGGETGTLIFGRYKMFPRALLFFHRGVPHITLKFFYDIRNLLSEELGVSLSIKMIFLKELLSFCLRMFPAIITFLVINTSNLPLDKFEPVQTFFVGSILFHSYSKVFLQRVSPNVDILNNQYLKSKLRDVIRKHNDTFYITNSNKQRVQLSVIPNGMKYVIAVTGCLVAYLVFVSTMGKDPLQIKVNCFVFSDYYLESRIVRFVADIVFITFLFHFVLLHFINQ